MSSPRPFRVLGVQQVAIGSINRQPLVTLWVELLGLEPVRIYRSERENVDELITRIGNGPASVEVDLMQPIDPMGHPRIHEPPLHHIGLWVDNLRAAVEWLSARGVRFAQGGIRKGASGHEVCFIHPKGNQEFPIGGCGVLIELVQAPPELIKTKGWP